MDAKTANAYLKGDIDTNSLSQDDSQPSDAPKSNESTSTNFDTSTPGSVEVKDNEAENQTGAKAPDGGQESKPSDDNSSDKPDDNDMTVNGGKLPYDPKREQSDDKITDKERQRANTYFIKQKRKFHAKLEAKDKTIADLKAKLLKYESITLDDLKGDESKMKDVEFERRLTKHDLDYAEAERQMMIEEDAAETAAKIHESRVEECFGSNKSEREHYQTLLENGREKFVKFLETVDPDHAVLQYLDDCDVSPLMVRVLMTKPNILRRVVEKTNPINKIMELKSIENAIRMERKIRDQSKTQPKPNPGKIPSTGHQNMAGSNSNVRHDRAYWNNYLKTH